MWEHAVFLADTWKAYEDRKLQFSLVTVSRCTCQGNKNEWWVAITCQRFGHVSKERSFRKGIVFALLRLSKDDGDKWQNNLFITIWLLKMSPVQAHNWPGDTSGLVWLLATFYLHMVWLANKDCLPVFLESLKWAWGFCVWTEIIYRSLGQVKLSPGNLLKWIETIRNSLYGCTNNSNRKYLANQIPFLSPPFLQPSYIQFLLSKSTNKMLFNLVSFFIQILFSWTSSCS